MLDPTFQINTQHGGLPTQHFRRDKPLVISNQFFVF